MTKSTPVRLLPCLAAILVLVPAGPACAVGSAFTYQGQLIVAGKPTDGDCDMMFTLFDRVDAGAPLDSKPMNNVPVKTGLFTVQLDFGASAFPGADRWLGVAVRCPAGGGDFTTLTPRQPVTTVPYAIRAMNANVLDAPGGGPPNALVVDSSGRIGIGTNTPTDALDVRGDLTLDAGRNPILYTSAASGEQSRYLLLVNSPATATASGLKAGGILVSDTYDFAQPGKNNLVVKGNVGIGTAVTDNSSRLTLDGHDVLNITGYAPYLTMSDSTEPGGPYISPTLYRLQTALGYFSLQRRRLCYLPPCLPFAEIMHIDPEGNIGVGTNLPEARIEVIGQHAFRAIGFQPYITLSDTNAGYALSRIQDVDGHIFFETDGYINHRGAAGFMVLRNDTGNVGIGTANPEAKLDVAGPARVQTVEITGGGDLAEPFRIASQSGRAAIEPGMVVVIDANHPGDLVLSSQAYDRRVAGVISGANGLSPGLVMAARGNAHADGDHPVALTGRVWTHCDATESAIEPGDLLTTSGTPGYAMKVADYARAPGAVLGKAMTRLARGGTGVVLTLVSLQ